jgi:ribosomal protein S27AE
MGLWKRIFARRLNSTRTELVLPFLRLDDFVLAISEHVTNPRGLQRDRAVDFFRAFCPRCHEPLDRDSIMECGSALSVGRSVAKLAGGTWGLRRLLRAARPACPRCGNSKCLVELIGLTADELAKMNTDLHDQGL